MLRSRTLITRTHPERESDIINILAVGPNCRFVRVLYEVEFLMGDTPTMQVGLYDMLDTDYDNPMTLGAVHTATGQAILTLDFPPEQFRLRFNMGSDQAWTVIYTLHFTSDEAK